MHKFIHRRLMPSLLGFFFRFFYSGRFRFYGSFFVFFKLFEEVLFYLFLYRLSFIQVGCRYSSLFLSYLYLVSYNLSFTRIDCLYSSFFFLFFICFHIIFPLFNEAVFIHLFSFSFLFSFSLSFIHIGCLYSSLFFSFFIYFHLVFPLFKQAISIHICSFPFLFIFIQSFLYSSSLSVFVSPFFLFFFIHLIRWRQDLRVPAAPRSSPGLPLGDDGDPGCGRRRRAMHRQEEGKLGLCY